MRKLASIQKIKDITPIKNADKIETLSVLGWKVVARKGQFQVGDLCVYFEIDSILPKLPEFEFMAKSDYRLNTVRLRGQLSQGLCWSLDILPAGTEIAEGLDVTEILGVAKHEEAFPEEMVGKSRGFHPTIVSKPSETRVQSFPGLIGEFQGRQTAFTTKVDGLASSYINDNGDIHVCSHTHSLIEDKDSVYWQMAYKYSLIELLKKIGNYSIQGEIAGPGIRGNKMGLSSIDLFVFKVFDNDSQEYLPPAELIAFCEKHGLRHVPMDLDIPFTFTTVEELLEMAKGTYQPSGKNREGVVIVPMQPCYSEILCEPLSMKVINNEYLL